MLKHLFPETLTVNKCPKIHEFFSCKNVDDVIQQVNESFKFSPYNEHTFYTSYVYNKPLIYLGTIL